MHIFVKVGNNYKYGRTQFTVTIINLPELVL